MRMLRRQTLKLLAASAGIFLPYLSASATEKTIKSLSDSPAANTGILRVTLHPPGESHFKGTASVSIRRGDYSVLVDRTKGEWSYEKVLPVGNYVLTVSTSEFATVRREVKISPSYSRYPIYLGTAGAPAYMLGGIEVPFKPRTNLIAVVFNGLPPREQQLKDLVNDIERIGLKRVIQDPKDGASLSSPDDTILYFVSIDSKSLLFSESADDKFSVDIPKEVEKLLAEKNARVGVPVNIDDGRIRILDSQFVIQFKKPMLMLQATLYATQLGATLLRKVDEDPDVWLIQFQDRYNYLRHLEIMRNEVQNGNLVYAEPNLIFQLEDHGCIRPIADPWEHCQTHLDRQKVYDAWCYIRDNCSDSIARGAPSVYLATLDKGVTYSSASSSSDHPEVNSPRMGFCYDLFENSACTGTPPNEVHGMGVYGIVSAVHDNGQGIKGIAPNVTHIVVRNPTIQDSVMYAQTLKWLGGIRKTPPTSKGPSLPPPPVDIISCSHGLLDSSVPSIIQDALRALTKDGRKGRGTIIIYSAGNDGEEIQGSNELAGSPYTIGVGNTHVASGKETREPTSNIGVWLDLCGNGAAAPSLLSDATTNGFWNCVSEELSRSRSGLFEFGGTSAAAPMVAAAAALMLSVNPNLTYTEVREILIDTSEKIDCDNSDILGKWYQPNAEGSTVPSECSATGLPRGRDWFSKWYGYGRLDVYAAVKSAHQRL